MQQIGFLCAANPYHKMVGTTKFNFIFLADSPAFTIRSNRSMQWQQRGTFVLVVSMKTKIALTISSK